jgi:hypothetical protein
LRAQKKLLLERPARLLGLDHRRLTFLFEGRQMRLTDVGGDSDFASRLVT